MGAELPAARWRAAGIGALMVAYRVRGVLLDIEGTTSAVSYVYDVLFPYARARLAEFLALHGADPEVRQARAQVEADAGAKFTDERALVAHLHDLMTRDVKATGLKALQGLIWARGYAAGELRSHVFADVPPALAGWNQAGLDVRIYSSGSSTAQQVFFAHTEYGDLTPWLRGHYDTTMGPKQAAASYTQIAAQFGLAPRTIVFLSDVSAELDAAAAVGMLTVLVTRPGNKSVPTSEHAVITNFAELLLTRG